MAPNNIFRHPDDPERDPGVNRLARLTGTNPVPARKSMRGYTYERNKFEIAGLTPCPAQTISPPRALECPIQMEAVVAAKHGLMEDDQTARGSG